MSGELFDLVNERDEVIGVTNKAESHVKALPYRVAAVFVFYGGKLLIQKRTPEKNGLIDHSVGGHVHQGEDYATAAIREMQEELGLVGPLNFIGKTYEDGHQFPLRHWLGLFEIEIGEAQYKALKLDLREMEYVKPMTLEEIAHTMHQHPSVFTGGFRCTLNLYIKHKNLPIAPVPTE